MDPDNKTLGSSQLVSSGKHEYGTERLSESFRDKLSLKENGQGALVSSVVSKDNSTLNCNKVEPGISSANQHGNVKKLVKQFSQENLEKETSSINRTLSNEINTKALSNAEIRMPIIPLGTEKINEKKVRHRSYSGSRYLTTRDENLHSEVIDKNRSTRRKSVSYHEDFSREIKQSAEGNVDAFASCMKTIERNFRVFNKQFDLATGKKRTRSQSTDNKQSVYATHKSDCEKNILIKKLRDGKSESVNDDKGGKTEYQPSSSVESKPATNIPMDGLSRANKFISDVNGDDDGLTKTGKEISTVQRKPKDVAEGRRDGKLSEETQLREDSGVAIAENRSVPSNCCQHCTRNLPALGREFNLESINGELRRLLEQVECIQQTSKDNLKNTNDLPVLKSLLNFKDIVPGGLLCNCMINHGMEKDIMPKMIGVLLQSMNLLASDFKDKLAKFEQDLSVEKCQSDLVLQGPSGEVSGNQDQVQSQSDLEVSVNDSSDSHSTNDIAMTKDDSSSTSKTCFPETNDASTQTDANCETCTQCGKEQVTVEKESTKANTTSVTSDTRGNTDEKSDQRFDCNEEVEYLKLPRRVISQNKSVCKNEKVLLLLGASGCGKTTLVKLIACFYAGIKSPDEYLFDDTRCRIENLVQHSSITAFTAYPENPDDTAITIIDTPGLTDSSGDLIQSRIDDLQRFLTNVAAQGLDINAIGFVIQAHVARLTPSEKLVMAYVRKHFKKCSAHIIPIISFADSQKDPPVLKAMKEFKMNVDSHFLFNNSVLTFDDNEEISDMDRLCWKRGFKCWRNICKLLLNLSPVKIFEIHGRKSSVAESAKSETKLEGPQAKKTKVASVQTAMNNCVSKEQLTERLDQSTNTETDACGTAFQKPVNLNDTRIERAETQSKALSALREAVIRFVTSLDNCSYSGSEEWKIAREEVWEKAATAYPFVDIGISCDVWLYSLAKEILSEHQTHKYNQVYLCRLSFSDRKPLMKVVCAVLRICKEVYYEMFKYYKNSRFLRQCNVTDLQEILLKNAEDIIEKTLIANEVYEMVNTFEFLNYILNEVDEDLGRFITKVMFKKC